MKIKNNTTNSINNINTQNIFNSGLDKIIDPCEFVKKIKNRNTNNSNRSNSRQKDYQKMARDYYQGSY